MRACPIGTGTYALAGVTMQSTVATGLQILAEAFRDAPGTANYQVGLRYVAVPDRLDVYASYGNRFGHASGRGAHARRRSPAVAGVPAVKSARRAWAAARLPIRRGWQPANGGVH